MIKYTALPTGEVRALQSGQPDVYGNTPERTVSDGQGQPCRHCLKHIPQGEEMLILAYRPFEALQPYAEVGPIFLCAAACERGGGEQQPETLNTSPEYLIKGYSQDDRIVYGTGEIVSPAKIHDKVKAIFANPGIAYVHARSATNNCYLARIDRDE